MKPLMSLTTRLTLLYALISSVVLGVFSVVIVSAIEQHFIEQDHDLVQGRFARVQTRLAEVSTHAQLGELHALLHDAVVGHQDMLVLGLMPEGRVVLQMPADPGVEARLRAAMDAPRTGPFELSVGGRPYRGWTTTLQTALPERPALRFALAIDIDHHAMFMARFVRSLSVLGVLAVLASALLGWAVARHGLAPLTRMRAQAERVTASRLDQRVSVTDVPLELAELADTLNAMLGRLEDAFKRLSAFSADLAHELRTPISNLMTQTQVILSQPRDADDYRDALESNAEELERMTRMVADMLFLAKADHGLMLPHREQVDLAATVSDLFDYYDAVAELGEVRLVRQGEATVSGDRLMLRRALGNLLSNAIRHTPPGGRVDVRIENGERVRVAVHNSGEPVAAEDLPHLFDRFYRADKARRHDASEGSGLGLAITQAVVFAHGGEISVSTDDIGSCFALTLPREGAAV